jgi:chromosome partitioning protein
MAVTLAIANQKGGVAKTTTVHALAVAMADTGRRVLAVDLDPQACLTYSFGLDPDRLDRSLHEVLGRRSAATEVIRPLRTCGAGGSGGSVSLLPASIDLAGAESQLLSVTGREHALAGALRPVDADFDVVLIDCPPSLGVLTINGLTAADALVIPLQCESLSQRGVGQLLQTVADVRAFANADLSVLGVVATMHDGRTRHAREVLESMGTSYDLEVLEPPIPKSVRFAEAPSLGRSIFEHAPSSPGAHAYRSLALMLLGRLDGLGGLDGPGGLNASDRLNGGGGGGERLPPR